MFLDRHTNQSDLVAWSQDEKGGQVWYVSNIREGKVSFWNARWWQKKVYLARKEDSHDETTVENGKPWNDRYAWFLEKGEQEGTFRISGNRSGESFCLDRHTNQSSVIVWEHDDKKGQLWCFEHVKDLPIHSAADRLYPEQRLRMGEQLRSQNGMYRAVMQQDGNFVVYKNEWTPLWESGTWHKPGFFNGYLLLSEEGVHIFEDNMYGSREIWKCTRKAEHSFLWMQDDGNLVFYGSEYYGDALGKHSIAKSLAWKYFGAIWATGTQGGRSQLTKKREGKVWSNRIEKWFCTYRR